MKSNSKLIKGTLEDKIFDSVNYVLLMFLVVVTLYPFLNTLVISLNDPIDAIRGGLYLWPREFTLTNYKVVLSEKNIYQATLISVLRTVIGGVLGVLASFMTAYGISRKDFVLRKFFTNSFILTMYIGGGLIPTYFLMRGLHLTNNFWVYILPMMVSAFNIMVVRSYIDGIPGSLIESAKMDGASEYRILFNIMFPLCIPVLATITLYVAVRQWNSWFDVFLYCSSRRSLSTLQYELQKVLQSSQQMSSNVDYNRSASEAGATVTPYSIRATMTIVATAPILATYPYLQKYFVKGLTLGGVKG